MTSSTVIRRVGWTAAVLAVCVLAGTVDAAQRGQRNSQRSAQRDDGPSRGRAQRQRDAKQEKQRPRNDDAAQKRAQRERNEQRAQKEQQQQRQKAESQRQAQQQKEKQRQRAEAQRQAERERAAQRQRQAEQQKRQEAERIQAQKNINRGMSAAPNDRGDNWGVNAQRKKLAERQARVHTQEKKLEVKKIEQRQDLREAKQRLENKIQHQKQELRARDSRLDARADALRHAANHTYTRPTHTRSFYKPDYDRHDRHHDDHNKVSVRFSFGNYYPSGFYYINGFRRHNCCTGGYWTWQWVRPLVVTRYDDCGNPYTVVIRAGYQKRVWLPHHCRHGLHVYYRY